MRFGYLSMNSGSGMRPAPLARELEARGFESTWAPERTRGMLICTAGKPDIAGGIATCSPRRSRRAA